MPQRRRVIADPFLRSPDAGPGLLALEVLARAIDAKDHATQRHSERVAVIAGALAAELGWEAAQVRAMREAALVHDVGKIGIDDAVLRKDGPLTAEERAHISLHAELSAAIVEGVLSPEQVEWIRTHHERPDGRGYPRGLGGDDISLGGGLLAVADAWDVMTVGRPYRPARDPQLALAECRAGSGRQFVRLAVEALERWLSRSDAPTGPEPLDSARPARRHGPGPAAGAPGARPEPALVSAHVRRREP